MTPYNTKPKITKQNIESGFVKRYFVKHVSKKNIVEVDEKQYNLLVKNPYYQALSFNWIIGGNDEDLPSFNGTTKKGAKSQNQFIIEYFDKKMKGLARILNNPLEFFSGTRFRIEKYAQAVSSQYISFPTFTGASTSTSPTGSSSGSVPSGGLGDWIAYDFSTPSSETWYAPAANSTTWVRVRGTLFFDTVGVDDIAYSTDTGTTWNFASSNSDVASWKAVQWLPFANLFAAVGTTAGNEPVMTSPDAQTWTSRTVTTITTAVDLAVATSEAVAITDDVSNVLKTTDGITWSTVAISGGPATGFGRIIRAESLGLYIATGYDGSSDLIILSSPDGVAWTTRYTFSGLGNGCDGIVWDATLGLVVGVTTDGKYFTSSNGTSYTVASFTGTASGFSAYGLATAGGFLVAVGDNNDILTSTDGSTWNRVVNATPNQHYAVTYLANGSAFIATPYTGGGGSSAYDQAIYTT